MDRGIQLLISATDARNNTRNWKHFLDDSGTAITPTSVYTMVTTYGALSAAAIRHYAFGVVHEDAAQTPGTGPYKSIGQEATMLFVGSDGSDVPFKIPAPKLTLVPDGRTVSIASGSPGLAIKTRVLDTTANQRYLTAGGQPIAAYVEGYLGKASQRMKQRKGYVPTV